MVKMMKIPMALPYRDKRLGPWPARLDALQSGSGLFLGLFMWLHMFFVSSILLGPDAMWRVARFFEGYYVFGRAYPWLVSLIVAFVFGVFITHAGLALRKFPASFRQYQAFSRHRHLLHHGDTHLWWIQVVTGFAMFFLGSVHLYTMMTQAELIGPYESADRVWTGTYWPLYLLLLFAVELHGTIGLYRLALKWGWPSGPDPLAVRARLHFAKWLVTSFFLGLGLVTLLAYVRIGQDHAPHAGQRYVPATISTTVEKAP